jgi:hypothetical protein
VRLACIAFLCIGAAVSIHGWISPPREPSGENRPEAVRTAR